MSHWPPPLTSCSSLTPIFLLTGLASMLNVFTSRLGRIAGRVDLLALDPIGNQDQRRRQRLRSKILDVAVLLPASAGGFTCAAALTLFFGALRNPGDGRLLFGFLGGAIACLVVALFAFSAETIFSGRSARRPVAPPPPETTPST